MKLHPKCVSCSTVCFFPSYDVLVGTWNFRGCLATMISFVNGGFTCLINVSKIKFFNFFDIHNAFYLILNPHQLCLPRRALELDLNLGLSLSLSFFAIKLQMLS